MQMHTPEEQRFFDKARGIEVDESISPEDRRYIKATGVNIHDADEMTEEEARLERSFAEGE